MSIHSEYEISEHTNSKSFYSSQDKNKSTSQLISEIFTATRSSSTIGATWNVINIIQGIGILGIPYAIMKSGWIGVAITIIAAFVSCSTGKMIIDCLYETYERQNIKIRVHNDYPDIGKKVWPRFGHHFVIILSVLEMFGASTLYVILLGTSSYTLVHKITNDLTEQHWFLIGACLVLCLLFIKHLSVISWFSFIAVVGLFGATITILSYCIIRYTDINVRNIYIISIKNLPISAGIIVFSYCAHPILPTIEASMKYPESFGRVMNISFIISTITKILFGVIPVCIFGSRTFQTISRNILYSDLGFFVSSKIFIIINVFFSMPLLIYIVLDRIDQSIRPHFHVSFWSTGSLNFLWQILSRVTTLSAILFVALIVPYFALVMGFIGSFTGTCLTFILPCWFSLVLKGKKLNIFQKIYRIAVIIMGVSIGCMGMLFSAIEMYNLSKRS